MVDIPADFVSDGCTWFPDVWRGIDLSGCCRVHDYDWFTNVSKDFILWLISNVKVSACFTSVGAWELAIPAFLATTLIGGILFYIVRQAKKLQTSNL